MTNEFYFEKLKDPRWQRRRLEIFHRDEWTCQKCYSNESTLHCHHRRYIPGRDPWDYPNELLVTLCESCHKYEREIIEDACADLIAIVREKFLADDIGEITAGLHELGLIGNEFIAQAIGWALSDPSVQNELINKYFQRSSGADIKKDQIGTEK